MSQICMHGYVSGLVQGVYFRQSTVEQAEQLHLNGWVRNLDDGRVEVLVEGDESAVRALTAWLRQGPSAAKVSAVELQELPLQGIAGFVQRH